MTKPEFIFKNDQYLKRFSNKKNGSETRLLAKAENVEVHRQMVPADRSFWLDSADEWQGFEFIYVLKGQLAYVDCKPNIILNPGDYIARQLVFEPSYFKTLKDTTLLYYSSQPSFQFLKKRDDAYIELVEQIEKDEYTDGHCKRIQVFSGLLGEKMGLSGPEFGNLLYAAYFHDLGKAKVPKHILRKTGKLTQKEWEVMKQHTVWGREMLEGKEHLQAAGKIVEQTHERVDGKGYPKGLKGDKISLEAKIISVVDSYDAMTTDRPYRKGLSQREAIRRLKKAVGTQLDGAVVDAFIEMLEDQGLKMPDFDQELMELKRHEALMKIGEEILANRDLDDILNQVVSTIVDHSPFKRAVLVLYAKPILPDSTEEVDFTRVACVGLSKQEEVTLKNNPLPAHERPKIFQEQFRLSRSFYIPYDQLPWKDHPGLIQGDESAYERGDWHPNDFLCIPLRVKDHIIGFISTDEPVDDHAPTRDTLEPIELLASFAALALDRTQHLERLKSIYKLSEWVTKVDSIDALLNQTMDELIAHFPSYEHASISFFKDGQLVLQDLKTRLPKIEYKMENFRTIPLDRGIIGWVARHREPQLVDDVSQDKRYIPGHLDIRSELAVPIEDQQELVGVFNLESRHLKAFTLEDLELAQALGRQLGTAINNLRHRQRLKESLEEHERINAFLQRLNQTTNLDEMFRLTIERGIDLLKPKADAGCLMLWNEEKQVFEFVASVNRTLSKIQKQTFSRQELANELFKDHNPLLLTRTQQLAHRALKRLAAVSKEKPPGSTIAVPIYEDEELVAVFNLNNLENENVFLATDAEKLTTLIPEIELALNRLRDRERLKHRAMSDPLTGVFNRHFLSEMIEKGKAQALHRSNPISLIMIDFAGFHLVNDRFGHLEGDRVLNAAAKLFQTLVRDTDAVIRYGGDEFLIVLPETEKAVATEICNRLESAFSSMNWHLSCHIAINTGIATWRPESDLSFERVLEEADAWMYRHKRRAKISPTPET